MIDSEDSESVDSIEFLFDDDGNPIEQEEEGKEPE